MPTLANLPPIWDHTKILTLAPDKFVSDEARRLAAPVHWPVLAHNPDEAAVWGDCSVNRQQTQHTIIDLTGPAFYCTCPSYKFPCKHAISLFLLYSEQMEQFEDSQLPGWVNEWLNGRERTPHIPSNPRPVLPNFKRDAQRQAKIEAGLQELEQWLQDLLRHGLAHLPGQTSKLWEQIAARMVDAGAVNVARELRSMATIPTSGRKKGIASDWPERLLSRIGRLQLLIQGFKQFDQLPPETQADLRTAAGWTPRKNTLTHLPPVHDQWSVVGTHIQTDGRLRIKRRWLLGTQTKKTALLLDYAHGRDMFRNDHIVPGLEITADLIFYPSAAPLRAFVATQPTNQQPLTKLFAQTTIKTALDTYSEALSHNPWLPYFHLALNNVMPIALDGGWHLRDEQGNLLPLRRRFSQAWHMLAISGGHPMMVFGEWDGESFYPFSLSINQGWFDLTVMRGIA